MKLNMTFHSKAATTKALAASLLVLTTTLLACPPGDDSIVVEGVVFDRTALLTGVVDNWLTPELAAFHTAATTLQTATSAHASAPTATTLTAAQDAWRAAMTQWQRLEPVQLGPLAAAGTRVGGQGLRDTVYSWPTTSACGVDQLVVKNEFTQAGWASTQLVNVIGLAAVEVALLSPNDDNACPGSATINQDGSWRALGDETVASRRAALAKVLADDVVAKATTIQTAMTSYGADLKSAGTSGSSFSTAQSGIDDVFAALFYVELKVKDRKLGAVAGLTIDCPASACPELLESRLSSTSKDHVLTNLQATRVIFSGAGGAVGFDDFLVAAGAGDLATEIVGEIDAAIAGVQAYDGTFEAHLLDAPADVVALYELVKAFADDFKADLASTLGVRIPEEGDGDND